jgi:hypothetical protein
MEHAINKKSSLGRHCIPSSLFAWPCSRRRDVSATLALFKGLHREPRIPNHQSGRQTRPNNKVNVTTNPNPWIETIKTYIAKIIGSDVLVEKTLALRSAAWAPNITTTYGSTIRRYFNLCEEDRLAPLAPTPAHMARYVAWQGQLGTSMHLVYNLTCRQSTASSSTTVSKHLASATLSLR